MKDEIELTDDQIRLATSRTLPSDAPLDSETASARDGFLSLGAAVELAGSEAAAGKFDDASLLARLQKSCLDVPAAAPRRREVPQDWVSLILAGALAAAGLV